MAVDFFFFQFSKKKNWKRSRPRCHVWRRTSDLVALLYGRWLSGCAADYCHLQRAWVNTERGRVTLSSFRGSIFFSRSTSCRGMLRVGISALLFGLCPLLLCVAHFLFVCFSSSFVLLTEAQLRLSTGTDHRRPRLPLRLWTADGHISLLSFMLMTIRLLSFFYFRPSPPGGTWCLAVLFRSDRRMLLLSIDVKSPRWDSMFFCSMGSGSDRWMRHTTGNCADTFLFSLSRIRRVPQ